MLAIAVFLAAQGVRSINDSKNIIMAKEEVETELTDRMVYEDCSSRKVKAQATGLRGLLERQGQGTSNWSANSAGPRGLLE